MAKTEKKDSEIIKERLVKLYPNFKFSVRRSDFAGGHSVYVSILSGNVKAFNEDDKGYYEVTRYYLNDTDVLTPEMKKIAKEILMICDEVNSGFASRHSSSYLHFQIGTYSKNYEYTGGSAPKSGGSSYTGRSSSTAKWDWGDRLGYCAGWDIYGKTYKDTYVYNLVKRKETPQNKTDWDKIRGEIATETNFKWTPRTQTFSRWGVIDDFEVVMSKLCAILEKYYQGSSSSEPTLAPAPTPTPPSEPLTQEQPSKEKIEKAIKGLKYLADKGDEKAMKAIKGLQYLLNK